MNQESFTTAFAIVEIFLIEENRILTQMKCFTSQWNRWTFCDFFFHFKKDCCSNEKNAAMNFITVSDVQAWCNAHTHTERERENEMSNESEH